MGLSMLGDKLSAGKAEQWGLIWQCVADDAFDGRLDELARHFADAPTKGLAYTKRALNQSLANSLTDHWGLTGLVGYKRLLGDAADSPLVEAPGSANQLTGEIGRASGRERGWQYGWISVGAV